MKLKLGVLAAAILVASCGSEQPLPPDYRTMSVEQNSEDATASLEEKEAMCLSEQACKPIEFGLTILQNGDVTDENGQLAWDGSTLIAEEGINSLWHFKVASKMRIPDNREFKFCLLYTSPSPRDLSTSRMPSSA